jgi:uncharacterized protein
MVPILLALLAVGAGIAGYAILVERRWYLTRRDHRQARFLASVPRADITVITGDILGEPEAVEFASRALRPVRGRLGSVFVLGSNDLYAPRRMNYLRYLIPASRRARYLGMRGRAHDLVRLLEREGWVHLRNRKYERRSNGLAMEVLGLDDPHIHRSDPRVAPRTRPDAFGLAVVHSPDPAPELAALGYDLVVAGHTHGGQVRLPLVGALVSNCSIPPRLARGLSRIGPAYLHVSPGLGTSKYAPFRFLCRPEATLLELRPTAQGESEITRR